MAKNLDTNISINLSGAILHVVVVGFHHKKGCVVEYSYPPLKDGELHDSSVTPEEWKHLPFLALPDGAHNYTEDVIYFHLPSKQKDENGIRKTIFCVSCYRQIDASLLKNKDKDVTRGTVQKSVVVLSKYPIFGLLHAKLQLITHAYFEEKDFSQKSIIKALYDDINMSVGNIDESCIFIGLSARNIILKFKHKIVQLFKLILLERRLVFFGSPVNKLVGTIMALLSLFPRMIDPGLSQCMNVVPYNPIKIVKKEFIKEESKSKEVNQKDGSSANAVSANIHIKTTDIKSKFNEEDKEEKNTKKIENTEGPNGEEYVLSTLKYNTDESNDSASTPMRMWSVTSNKAKDVAHNLTERLESISSLFSETDIIAADDSNFGDFVELENEDEMPNFGNARLEMQNESPTELSIERSFTFIHTTTEKREYKTTLPIDEFGFPLSIFTDGHLCMPYVALQQHSILQNNIERGFVAGATNMLFKTHTHMSDILVDIESSDVIFNNTDLKRLLHLSSADLRFADHLVSLVSDHGNGDVFLDATGWEGGDEWIHAQFAEYLRSMLSFSVQVCPNPKDTQDFNDHFLSAWKQTKNYQIWLKGNHTVITDEKLCHPFQAQYSVSDMRLRLHHNLQSSERGRKIEDAVSTANQAVSNTGKFMGNALLSAKSSMTSWFSNKLSTDTSNN